MYILWLLDNYKYLLKMIISIYISYWILKLIKIVEIVATLYNWAIRKKKYTVLLSNR